ncbi:MAG: single-stranded DNA-binding protein [Intrasporangium sp.]|uniref:single-stranded DNA-binding protein n=1 Tax=Intrasporangium sp. TaxID=1925024 RepID=UPI0026486E79|nr:single-stranded DNA-binding protein [Intrasporangium sp.]MDN5797203.1 single-stranded DNA-binding protein [Intrasporangium sp.]
MQGNGITGNLTEAPIVNTLTGGRQVARFTVAVNDGYRDKTGQWHDRPAVFFRVESWADAAAAATWPKGARVAVVGHWQASEYEKDGEKRRQQYFAAEAAALVVPRQRTQANEQESEPEAGHSAADADAIQLNPDDPYAAAS